MIFTQENSRERERKKERQSERVRVFTSHSSVVHEVFYNRNGNIIKEKCNIIPFVNSRCITQEGGGKKREREREREVTTVYWTIKSVCSL